MRLRSWLQQSTNFEDVPKRFRKQQEILGGWARVLLFPVHCVGTPSIHSQAAASLMGGFKEETYSGAISKRGGRDVFASRPHTTSSHRDSLNFNTLVQELTLCGGCKGAGPREGKMVVAAWRGRETSQAQNATLLAAQSPWLPDSHVVAERQGENRALLPLTPPLAVAYLHRGRRATEAACHPPTSRSVPAAWRSAPYVWRSWGRARCRWAAATCCTPSAC